MNNNELSNKGRDKASSKFLLIFIGKHFPHQQTDKQLYLSKCLLHQRRTASDTHIYATTAIHNKFKLKLKGVGFSDLFAVEMYLCAVYATTTGVPFSNSVVILGARMGGRLPLLKKRKLPGVVDRNLK